MYATFQCTVNIIDEALRESISQDLYRQRKTEVGDVTADLSTEDTEDEDLIGYDAIEPGLPPASSDRQKWWLDNQQPAQARVQPPKQTNGQSVVLNPSRPPNPFGVAQEQEWITVPRSTRVSSFSGSLSSSPYEHVQIPGDFLTSTPSSGQRRPPPASNGEGLSAQVSGLSFRDDARLQLDGTPPPPPPPRRSANPAQSQAPLTFDKVQPLSVYPPRPASALSDLSQLSQQSRSKPAPPVAKKPLHLTSGSPTLASRTGRNDVGHAGEERPPPLPVRASTGFEGSHGSTYSDSPTRLSTTSSRAGTWGANQQRSSPMPGAMQLPGMGAGEDRRGPLQAPRKIQNAAPIDLLGGSDDDGSPRDMGGWETLTPNTYNR